MAAKMTNEIFSIANGLSSDEERVNYLRQNATKAVRALLIYNFSDTKFLLPEGRPELRTEEDFNPQRGYVEGVDDGATLNYEMRKMYLFYEGGHPTLTSVKRETLWIELINSLHPSEADDLWHMKDKQLQKKYKKITHLIAYNSFPEGLQQPQPESTRDSHGRFTKTENPKKKKKVKK